VTPALAAHGLTKRYGPAAAVDALDLTVERGELYGFLGPNGAGKTTTIRMALGLIVPSAGDVDLLGERVRPDRAPLERVGALVEEPAFWRYLSGRRNLEYLARAGGGRADVRARLARVDEVLGVVGLAEAADKRVKAYSQGMRQRLGVALALLGEPDLLVLDEPTNGLDPSGMREMRLLLRRLADDGTSIFVSSHLLAEVEAMCDRVGVMAQGRLVAEGPPSSLRGVADRVRVEVDDVGRAAQVIAGIEGVTISTETTRADAQETSAVGTGIVRVTLAGGVTPAVVNAALVGADIAVHALVPERSSLEDVFLELVEGADVPR
jgi:ABC-2 type transport system ATP-binding protein